MPKQNLSIRAKTKDLMQVPPITIRETASIDEAAGSMWEKNVGSIIIVGDDGKMKGILTERDILYAVSRSLIGRAVPVTSIMSKTSIKASPNESIVTVVNRMTKMGVRHLPVVDKDDTPVGVISMRDAMGISEPLLKFVFRPVAQSKKRKPGTAH